jgi:DNA-binding beta-propeller fold protein YncE
MRRLALLLVMFEALARADTPPSPLVVVRTDALPGVQHRIDHFAIDAAGRRLFVSALGNHTLEVLDAAAGRRITSLAGLNEPQGVAYVPSLHRIVVATRAGGTVTAFDGVSYRAVGTLGNLHDADNLRLDAATGLLYLGHGDGALAVIDPATMTIVADIPLGGHPESFQLEAGSARIFVNLPPAHEVVVVDRARRAVVGHVALAGFADNYPMSLDDRGHRMFVGARSPARLLVFDTTTLQRVAAVTCVGDTDDLYYDARRDRVYVIGGQGYVDVFDASPAGHYARLAHIATRAGARTGFWSSDLDRLFVASPQGGGQPATIEVLAPASVP